jgi:D-sedoheptulose 7-phosphate isomerase
MKDIIIQRISESIRLRESIQADEGFIAELDKAAVLLTDAVKKGNKIWFCGNGGSAADAQHLAAELTGRFAFDRKPMAAEALHVNTSYLTAVANDYSFDEVYARYLEGNGKTGDVLVAFSTSGNSKNVVRAAEMAVKMGIPVIAFTGKTGGALRSHASHCICVPSERTPEIQEVHILAGHILCEEIETRIFGK